MEEKIIECSDEILKLVSQEILKKENGMFFVLNYPGGDTAFINDRDIIVQKIKEQRLDELSDKVFESFPDLSRIEVINNLITTELKVKEKQEKRKKQREELKKITDEKKRLYFEKYPGQDYEEWGDFSPFRIEKSKYFVKDPVLFQSAEWESLTFYYVYMHENEKYVAFIGSIFVDDLTYYVLRWTTIICHIKINKLLEFGIEEYMPKLFHYSIPNSFKELCDDSYDALEYANMFLHLGATKMSVTDINEDTECGYYFDDMQRFYIEEAKQWN